MQRVVLIVVAVFVVFGLTVRFTQVFSGVDFEQAVSTNEPLIVVKSQAPDETWIALRVKSGTTLGEVLSDVGLPASAIRRSALSIYDLAKLRPDRDLQLVYVDGEKEPVGLRYGFDEDSTVRVDRRVEGWQAHLEEVQYTTRVDQRTVLLERSLWQDGIDAGLRPADLVSLATIFEYELDFNTELRKGAILDLVADVLESPGRSSKLGTIHAARFYNAGEIFTGLHYVQSSGREGYYHPDGTGMKRPFLRSPLEFSRVSSGFSRRRFHPILKRARAHNGVDFAARTGVPVRAVADGRILMAKTNGGHGRFVKIRHDGAWQTSYSHLSRILVKHNQRVRQGQIIGKVGSTGLATGPHLHYQMWKNGSFVDPMKISLPRSQPLPRNERAVFKEATRSWLGQLDALSAGR
jgi:murein DD-endopeptidase MepM/ murein hydrolase activator NlpD